MIGFTSDKIKEEWTKAPAPLRLVVEAMDQAHGGATFVFRVNSPTRFEGGVHSTGLAMDVQLRGMSPEAMLVLCIEINQRFPVKGPQKQVCTLMADPANLPSGKRMDTPHVHVQIPLDWKADPRAFLREYGYLQGS